MCEDINLVLVQTVVLTEVRLIKAALYIYSGTTLIRTEESVLIRGVS